MAIYTIITFIIIYVYICITVGYMYNTRNYHLSTLQEKVVTVPSLLKETQDTEYQGSLKEILHIKVSDVTVINLLIVVC